MANVVSKQKTGGKDEFMSANFFYFYGLFLFVLGFFAFMCNIKSSGSQN